MSSTLKRPFEEAYPVYKIDDVYNFEKYFSKKSSFFTAWIWFQVSTIILITLYMLANVGSIGSPAIFVYGGFIFLFIYALTDLMDGNRSSIFWEFLKATYGLMIIFTTGDWFGLSKFVSYTNSFVLLYFIISIGVTLYLATENKKTTAVLQR